ncbi:LOW QUALITY PROTEIN: hypothetical protein M513_01502 [Trichuris suis]|uniref:Uncharacterized protein n=1 Tax=Trichuris suis TaxID=68888 RepID=A0A085MKT6_9BILA|nr:LOW QUALITY PROTEIN: hypothetical protein M513_01502 [Trichuris suis]
MFLLPAKISLPYFLSARSAYFSRTSFVGWHAVVRAPTFPLPLFILPGCFLNLLTYFVEFLTIVFDTCRTNDIVQLRRNDSLFKRLPCHCHCHFDYLSFKQRRTGQTPQQRTTGKRKGRTESAAGHCRGKISGNCGKTKERKPEVIILLCDRDVDEQELQVNTMGYQEPVMKRHESNLLFEGDIILSPEQASMTAAFKDRVNPISSNGVPEEFVEPVSRQHNHQLAEEAQCTPG